MISAHPGSGRLAKGEEPFPTAGTADARDRPIKTWRHPSNAASSLVQNGTSMFKLLRYFSLTSAVAILLVTVVLVILYRQTAVNELVELAENQNVVLARSFANTIWPRFSAYVTSVSGLDGDALRARPETLQIHETLKGLAAGLPVLKVKIYNLDGLTVFSSQASQIGEDKSNSPGFIAAAREGRPASKQAHRDRFSTFSGEVADLHLVESYLPIRRGDGRIEGVFELYSDVTPLMGKIARSTDGLAAGLDLENLDLLTDSGVQGAGVAVDKAVKLPTLRIGRLKELQTVLADPNPFSTGAEAFFEPLAGCT